MISNIDQSSHINIFNQISNGGTLLQTSWNTEVNITFSPDFCIITNFIYNTDTATDTKLYQVNSSLKNDETIATFHGSNTTKISEQFGAQIIKLSGLPINNISFDITSYTTDGTNIKAGSGFSADDTSSILIGLDFIKLKK